MCETVEFKSNGDMGIGCLVHPSDGPGPGVIVLQEWWGVVPHIKDVANRFAEAGFTALVPDVYRGVSSSEPDQAMKLMMSLSMDRCAKDMSGAVDHLLEVSSNQQAVGVVGFCMGGGLALMLGCQRPDVVKAVVPFYGLIPWAESQPDYSALEGAVLGHYAEKDGFASPEVVKLLNAELQDLGKRADFHIYEGTDHAFFNDDRPEVYDRAAAELAFSRTIDFLRTELSTNA